VKIVLVALLLSIEIPAGILSVLLMLGENYYAGGLAAVVAMLSGWATVELWPQLRPGGAVGHHRPQRTS